MKAVGDKILAKRVEIQETPEGIQLPQEEHPFMYEVLSAGGEARPVSAGDYVAVQGSSTFFPYKGDKVEIYNAHQIAARFSEDEIYDTVIRSSGEDSDATNSGSKIVTP